MSFINKVWKTQQKLEERFRESEEVNMAEFYDARKPTTDEFVKSSWVVGIGITIVGFIGFVVYYVWLRLTYCCRFIRNLKMAKFIEEEEKLKKC